METLIKDALILTQNEKREQIQGDILIKDSKIKKIGKNLGDAELVIDAKGKIAIPGLINTHTHIPMTLLRGYGEDLPLHEWLEKKIWPAESKLTPDDIYWGTMLGAVEMIRSGTTCYNEMYLVGLDEIANASKEIGIRATICSGMIDKLPGKNIDDELSRTKKFIKDWKNKSDLIKPGISPHALYTCSEELLLESKKLSEKEHILFHIHASETRKELFDILKEKKKRPFEYMDELGLMDSNSLYAHASWVSKREISLAGKKSLNISHCPVSNLKLATGGICPISEYEQEGANVTLGTDGAASNNSLNMFETMKFASLLQKHKYWKADKLPTRLIFDYATRNGAKALRINSGSIEEEKLADIVLLDSNTSNLTPSHDSIANLIYSSNPSNITDVLINGKVIIENKIIKSVNERKILEKSREIALRISKN